MANTFVYAISEPLCDGPNHLLRSRDRGNFFFRSKAAGIDRAGDLIDIVADGGKLTPELSVSSGGRGRRFTPMMRARMNGSIG